MLPKLVENELITETQKSILLLTRQICLVWHGMSIRGGIILFDI